MATRGASLIAAAMVAASAVAAVALVSSAATGHPAAAADVAGFAAVPPPVAAPAAAPAEPKTTLHLPTTLHLFNATIGASTLDSSHVVFAAGLTRKSGSKRVVGTASYTCLTNTGGGLHQSCRGAIALRDGILLVTEEFDLATARITGKVIGGSGSYKGARGDLTGTAMRGGKSKLNIHYSLG